jgi:hypothetical protein
VLALVLLLVPYYEAEIYRNILLHGWTDMRIVSTADVHAKHLRIHHPVLLYSDVR